MAKLTVTDATLGNWRRTARWRRLLLAVLVAAPTFPAAYVMARVLPGPQEFFLRLSLLAIFMILFAWIAMGFWTAIFGFIALLTGRDRFLVRADPAQPLPREARTALLMPVCNEDPQRVFARLRATWLSLQATGQGEQFAFFVLSDTREPDVLVEEARAWAQTVRELGAEGRIHYRRRRVNLKRKSGNVADFCRRWGRDFRYMVVLDADSLMDGDTLIQLVRRMEAHPRVGIIQAIPLIVNATTPLARMQQFVQRLCGPMFTAGLNFWMLGHATYWGHNAIIRVAPFMAFCGLPRLPGPPPLGGDILSHDFVEAACMVRGGWEVWVAYDLQGSYEETPPTLLDELQRDRRWCQGNLQHLRLLRAGGFHGLHRAMFFHGAMGYVSALFWFAFLFLGTVLTAVAAFTGHQYFTPEGGLFPVWPVARTPEAITLMIATLVMLLLPKTLGAILAVSRAPTRQGFGGARRVFVGLLAELAGSVLMAPIRMIFHTRFVLYTLFGQSVRWAGQNRGDEGTSWGMALRHHGFGTLLGLVWGGVAWAVEPVFFLWLSPVMAGLVLSIPISVYSGRRSLGDRLQRRGLFRVPGEIEPPAAVRASRQNPHIEPAVGAGFIAAVADPQTHHLHLSLLRDPHGRRRIRWPELRDRAWADGPDALSANECRLLLGDSTSLRWLHQQIWIGADPARAAAWGVASNEPVTVAA
jgi:membrane glycosyltransferase